MGEGAALWNGSRAQMRPVLVSKVLHVHQSELAHDVSPPLRPRELRDAMAMVATALLILLDAHPELSDDVAERLWQEAAVDDVVAQLLPDAVEDAREVVKAVVSVLIVLHQVRAGLVAIVGGARPEQHVVRAVCASRGQRFSAALVPEARACTRHGCCEPVGTVWLAARSQAEKACPVLHGTPRAVCCIAISVACSKQSRDKSKRGQQRAHQSCTCG